MSDDVVLDRVAVAQLLDRLAPEHRLVIELTFGLIYPEDWPWPEAQWPPTYAAVGWYVGSVYRGKPLSEATIRYMRTTALRELHAIEVGIPSESSKITVNRVRKRLKTT